MTKQERNDKIVEMTKLGYGIRKIAAELGISKTTVANIIKLQKSENPSVLIKKDYQVDRLQYIDIALRLLSIQLHPELLKKVVSVVDLINKKGGKSNLEDVIKCSLGNIENIEVVSEDVKVGEVS